MTIFVVVMTKLVDFLDAETLARVEKLALVGDVNRDLFESVLV